MSNGHELLRIEAGRASPERVCADIAQHDQEKVAPNGFGAQVVTLDRESCLLYKRELDQHLPPEVSDIVMSVNSGEDQYAAYRRDRGAEEKLLDRFRGPGEGPLQRGKRWRPLGHGET